MVLQDLWEGEDGFDGEAEVPEEGDVEAGVCEGREDDLDYKEAAS